ncbi:tyrosine-type recombinase/integrase [Flavobacterium sp. NKUCC04_CG]|uniref:tyrosine-type recombinase/integrase n=1 Tax=Flavobacterium sp. NKUCC04_CG TaxID=2842121 RepID=UPI001C5B01F3|nr:tyrosine-type recombinase/integrase [Flavobacterium sp. NKUCC04_CG]MBW3517710.1 tyrosine-type recombinase/integrase [Flavobacterium sp. NKUCC04_CG]
MNTDLQKYVDYLVKEKNFSPKTVSAYSSDVEGFLVFLATDTEVGYLGVTYDHVRAWVVELSEQGLSNNTINRKTSALKSFYSFLLRLQLVAEHPLKSHVSLRVDKKIQVPFSVTEVRAVLGQFDQSNQFEDVRDRLVVELLYALGLRRAELLALEVDDLDFYNDVVRVCGKRNKVRLLPMIKPLKNLLKEYLSLRGVLVVDANFKVLIISKHANKVSETFVYRLINKYFSHVSSKEKKSPHMLRHTFATHLLNNGADINAIKELMGHASLSSTQVYAHSSLDQLKLVYQNAHPRVKKDK